MQGLTKIEFHSPRDLDDSVTQTFAPEWWQEDDVETVAPIEINHHVTAIVVSHNGARWLPICLSALETQSRPADAVMAVDIASSDEIGRAHV